MEQLYSKDKSFSFNNIEDNVVGTKRSAANKDQNDWRIRVSISLPHACKAHTLPIELIPLPVTYQNRILKFTCSLDQNFNTPFINTLNCANTNNDATLVLESHRPGFVVRFSRYLTDW